MLKGYRVRKGPPQSIAKQREQILVAKQSEQISVAELGAMRISQAQLEDLKQIKQVKSD
jgi:hypothetical protein